MSLDTSEVIRPFFGPGDSSSRMWPPFVPPPPLQSVVPDGGPTQQYQSQNQAHWYGSRAQPTNVPMSQPPQSTYGYPPTFAGPHYSDQAYPYAAHIPTGSSAQGQEQYYSMRTAVHSQPTQANQQPPSTSATHLTSISTVYTPTIPSGSGRRLGARRAPPMDPVAIPPSASVSPVTPSSSASNAGAARPFAPVSAVGSQIPHGDSSTRGQEYSSGPTGYTQPQLYSQQPYTSTTNGTPAEVAPLANDPSSHISPHSLQANRTASVVAPNSRTGPCGTSISIDAAGTGGEPTPIGPSRTTNRQQGPKPYIRRTPAIRKTRPITYEGNLVRLQQRCKGQGAGDGAIELLGKIFADQISLEALTRPLTDGEAETKEFGIGSGMIYTALLEHPDEENDGYTCRLCHTEQTWKHHRDVLRHLRRDHFGISDDCDSCMKKFYTKSEKKKHPCK